MTGRQAPSLADVGITARAAVTCVGRGRTAHVQAMREMRSGLAPIQPATLSRRSE